MRGFNPKRFSGRSGHCRHPRQQLLIALFFPIFCAAQDPEIVPTAGQVITESCRIAPGDYRFDGAETGFDRPVLTIKGNHIEVDFQGATFFGNGKKELPDQFSGLGIKVEGKKISIRNLNVRGYKIGLLAVQCADLQLVASDFSYNWRPRLQGSREKEAPADQLDHRQNDHDEWQRHGAGIYLKNCRNALVDSCSATANQNALLLSGCTGGRFYNNDFRFNSGIGIGLYRSSENSVMHNRLNWNVRGFSQNTSKNGQGSAGILCLEQSGGNTFGFNSATHSGNGFLGGAGQSTMETGKSGCNDNLIYGNDFSYAPANGIEMTFSRNRIWSNYMDDCGTGISAGHSFYSDFGGNTLRNCGKGIVIEDGRGNQVSGNNFENDTVGIHLFGEIRPADLAYPADKNTRSVDAFISENKFSGTHNPLKISGSDSVFVDPDNVFSGFKKMLDAPDGADSAAIFFQKKPGYLPLLPPLCPPLGTGIDAKSGIANRRGRHWIWMTDWGPYDFRGPICFLKKADGNRFEFWMNADGSGTWQVKKAKGFKNLTMTGGFPSKLVAERNPDAEEIYIQFEAVFNKGQVDVFGKKIPAGQPYLFDYQRFEPKNIPKKDTRD